MTKLKVLLARVRARIVALEPASLATSRKSIIGHGTSFVVATVTGYALHRNVHLTIGELSELSAGTGVVVGAVVSYIIPNKPKAGQS